MGSGESSPRSHPLDPITASEIETAREVLFDARDVWANARIVNVDLEEPDKDALRGPGDVERTTRAVVRDHDGERTYEATVSLDDEELRSWETLPDAQPPITVEEFIEAEGAVKADSDWQAAVRARGVEDVEQAIIDAFPAGYHLVPDEVDPGRRLAHCVTWVRVSDADNAYERPLDGIHAFVDLDEMDVAEVIDNGAKRDVSELSGYVPYRAEDRDLRDLKPYEVSQPEGPSWDIDGRKVEWQNWHIRVGWSQREGLVLHDIGYEDDGEVRPILNRASLAEMTVPYGDPDPNHSWKSPLDVGELTFGRLANSLTEGCDCLGYMHYWDAVVNDSRGEPDVIPNAICLHEEDFGVLWKHGDWRTRNTEVRRNRRLVISFIVTAANYDYAFYWYFYQDGSIEAEVRLTGVDNNGLVGPDESVGGYAEEVQPHVKAMNHQHFFTFRLDFEVDGPGNDVYRVQNETLPEGPHDDVNPDGNAFYADRTHLTSEQEAQDLIDPLKGRYWVVRNRDRTNELGNPVGYRLEPNGNVEACARPGSSVMRRAGFIDNHLWVTPYRHDERFPAGKFPNQSPGSEGLPAWTEADRSLENEDLVVWYNLGVNHVTRPEDWPILPVQRASFRLSPDNFFDSSPAADVPPEHCFRDV
ncbi:tyramine oxidase [Halobacteriales archaeon QS_1_68_20]|nr:MAG: tyramine oxidase [Halobacteriales archaeon QS_1_68_20]